MRKEKTFALLVALFSLCLFSCSEDDGGNDEFGNWKERNETYFKKLYETAKSSGNAKWRTYRSWSLQDAAATAADDHIVVEVLAEGVGTGSPLFTDSVKLHYRGNLMPTVSYPDGLQFDSSWLGEYNLSTMFPVKAVTGGFINGFTTALMQMHTGDRWRIYIPSALAYSGDKNKGVILPYSTLVFDVTLVDYWH
ncbi:MAG: FKBP-type peptidyl-prolyl cis-trans isomerase [Prevotella sp.]|uniref:FKBP-type peptidyl-prolyl cis-trans isomerase n=1 Tax=Prevotella sp. TaxID=59823 RepID=UPI002A289935|nr:FKBP-type peptidyl-prolyl cis-trans isomerase [Prevotella sp.]MDD7317680.1 FKBP-type peptidyl-prolyl cis-trans isomerase [Prevotellaceae bacterium]MDY4020473.1 FKBP-type peptidyl-prolyl cis-trans isomerase [Prevotella sp.]